MKPREFWIVQNRCTGDLTGYDSEESYQCNIEHNENLIHVRECVPIDWEKIRQEAAWMEKAHYGLKEIFNTIQQLVEKQLAGEE